MEEAREPYGAGRRTPGAQGPALATNSTRGRALSSESHTEGGEGEAGCCRNALSCGEDLEKAGRRR